jgi:uroporphyrinogen-III synthase
MSRPLLVLRPEPEAQATAARAQAMGLTALVRPLFGGVALEWTMPDGEFDALMMTSANAVRFGGPGLDAYHTLPLYTVGAATATAAQAAGFTDIRPGQGGVQELLMRIALDAPGRIFFPSAREITAHPEPLFEIVNIAVYAMEALPAPALPVDGVALIHSNRAGDRLSELVTARAGIDIVAISENAASGIGTGWRSLQWPSMPTDAAMLALAAPLCED